jgi:hypothetical protein
MVAAPVPSQWLHFQTRLAKASLCSLGRSPGVRFFCFIVCANCDDGECSRDAQRAQNRTASRRTLSASGYGTRWAPAGPLASLRCASGAPRPPAANKTSVCRQSVGQVETLQTWIAAAGLTSGSGVPDHRPLGSLDSAAPDAQSVNGIVNSRCRLTGHDLRERGRD